MLVEFQKVVTDVENQEAELQKEYKQLQTMQDDLIAKQDNVNQLLTSKQSEIQKLDSELGDTKNKLAQLEAAAAAAEKKQKAVSYTHLYYVIKVEKEISICYNRTTGKRVSR